MVTALRAPCGVLRDSFVAQPCKSRINIFKLYSPLPFRFMGHKEGPRWHNGLTEVCKVMEQGDEINLSSPVRLFPPEISGSSQIISGVLEHRVEQADFCTGISVGFALFQAGVASWQPPPDVFKRWGSSQASCAASSLCPAMSCNVLRRPWAAGPVFCPSCVPRVPQLCSAPCPSALEASSLPSLCSVLGSEPWQGTVFCPGCVNPCFPWAAGQCSALSDPTPALGKV